MSVEAISWALNLAPVPTDRGGQPSTACKFVLVGLANHAGPDGIGAFPSVATLVRYTGLSERTVRSCLDRLQADGIITPCDPDIVAARIKRADRRPQGWDLDLSLVRDDLDEPGERGPTRQPSVRRALLSEGRLRDLHDGHPAGVQPLHPAALVVNNSADKVPQLHPAAGAGCNQRANGVQSMQPRGAAIAPEPSKEPYLEPSAAQASARDALIVGVAAGGGPVGEFFAALGDAWLVTAAQQAKLMPAVQAALERGWTPRALAEFTGANSNGVHSPYAVLAARLSASELPRSPGQGSARPPWCGECDERTRMLGFDSDAPRRCPRCKTDAGRRDLPVSCRIKALPTSSATIQTELSVQPPPTPRTASLPRDVRHPQEGL